MKRSEVFSGNSIEEAKAKAAESFGVPQEKITFTEIEDVKKGLFGRIKSEAKVRAEYEEIEEPAAPAEIPAAAAEPEVKAEEAVAETPAVSAEGEAEAEAKEIPQEKVDICQRFLEKVLEKMELNCAVEAKVKDGGIFVEIDSSGSGAIIGRRGETLDSLQYLCSLVVNKSEGDYIRITLDSCGYREKRTETLKQLAEKISSKVLKSGRSTVLEPMNPYERRIIHSAVAAIDGVSSKSVGEEPYRKVIISSDNPRRGNNFRKGGHGRGNGRGGNGRPRREHRKVDFKTSFEKDYKKPKPEDDINAGLYGKIEI